MHVHTLTLISNRSRIFIKTTTVDRSGANFVTTFLDRVNILLIDLQVRSGADFCQSLHWIWSTFYQLIYRLGQE